ISGAVVTDSLGIGKALRVKRFRKHLRRMANELARMNYRWICHRIDPLIAHGANLGKLIPDRYGIFPKISFRALDHVDDHFRIQGEHGLLIDLAIAMLSYRRNRLAAGNAYQFVEIAAFSRGIKVTGRTGHPIDYAQHPSVRTIHDGLPHCIDLRLSLGG